MDIIIFLNWLHYITLDFVESSGYTGKYKEHKNEQQLNC